MSPLNKGDHPKLDTSQFLEEDGVVIYQSLIGAMQWAISIGRFDIQRVVMTMSGFRAQPRIGHLERVNRIYSYLIKYRHFRMTSNVKEPDFSTVPVDNFDWSNTPYGNGEEDLPDDSLEPKGKRVVLSH